jgi:hypothetical protein
MHFYIISVLLQHFVILTEYNVEITNLHCLQNVTPLMKRRRFWRAGNAAFLSEEGDSRKVWWGKLRERDHSEDIGLDGRKY